MQRAGGGRPLAIPTLPGNRSLTASVFGLGPKSWPCSSRWLSSLRCWTLVPDRAALAGLSPYRFTRLSSAFSAGCSAWWYTNTMEMIWPLLPSGRRWEGTLVQHFSTVRRLLVFSTSSLWSGFVPHGDARTSARLFGRIQVSAALLVFLSYGFSEGA